MITCSCPERSSTMADSASKRRRLSWGSSGKPSPGAALQLVPSTQHEQQDIIEFFAQRGERKKELEAQVQALESNAHEMQARLAKTEATVAQQKVHKPKSMPKIKHLPGLLLRAISHQESVHRHAGQFNHRTGSKDSAGAHASGGEGLDGVSGSQRDGESSQPARGPCYSTATEGTLHEPHALWLHLYLLLCITMSSPALREGMLHTLNSACWLGRPASVSQVANPRVRHKQQRRQQIPGWQKPRGRPGASVRSWTAGLPGWRRSCTSRRWTLTTTEGGLKQRSVDSSSSSQWPNRLQGRLCRAACW